MDATTIEGAEWADKTEAELGLEVIPRERLFHDRPGLRYAKRALDLFLCVAAMPVVVPLMALCALAIKLDSHGPVFFVHERVGRGGRLFRMYKFRTMFVNVDSSTHKAFMKAFVNGQIGQNGADADVYKPVQQSQITRMGRFLRKTSLDELPQLINVLRGEMSLVGPRPNLPWEVEEYRLWHHERLEVLPGLTGLAQVRGRSSIPFEQIIEYDLQYVKNMSLALDLRILFETVGVILRGRGAY